MRLETNYKNVSRNAACKNMVRAMLSGEDCSFAVAVWGDAVFKNWLQNYVCGVAAKLMQKEPVSQTARHQYTVSGDKNLLGKRERVDDKFFDITSVFKSGAVSLELSFWESATVFDAIAAARQKQQRNLWSTAGKQVEKPLMTTLCRLFQVDEKHFVQSGPREAGFETDFVLIDGQGRRKKCEVKLMGKAGAKNVK